jgi:hypothetical protein
MAFIGNVQASSVAASLLAVLKAAFRHAVEQYFLPRHGANCLPQAGQFSFLKAMVTLAIPPAQYFGRQ